MKASAWRRSLGCALLLAAAVDQSRAAEVRQLEMGEVGPRVWLKMVVQLDAPPASVFAVITDYDNIDRLHRRVRESRVIRHIDARTVEVYTLLRGCVAALFCRTIRRVEEVTERPPNELIAWVLPEKSDFAYGVVRWRLEPDGGGSLLNYETEIEPDFWVPHLFGDALLAASLRRTTAQMIERVEELARRRPAGGGEPWDPPLTVEPGFIAPLPEGER
jgi:hypothetical protein